MAAMPPSTPPAQSFVLTVNEASFQQEVLPLSAQIPVLLAFWRPSSAPSKQLVEDLETFANLAQGAFVLAKVNIDNNMRIAQSLQVQSVPDVKLVFQGQMRAELKEALPKDKLRGWLQGIFGPDAIPEPEADPLQEGKAHLEAGDVDAAIASFNAHLQKHPGAPESSLALARIALDKKDKSTARALLAQVSETLTPAQRAEVSALEFMLDVEPPERAEEELRAAISQNSLDYQARHDLAMLFASQGKIDDALEELLAIVIRDRSWEDDRARLTMVKLFEVMGLQNPETRAWQKKLGRAMY